MDRFFLGGKWELRDTFMLGGRQDTGDRYLLSICRQKHNLKHASFNSSFIAKFIQLYKTRQRSLRAPKQEATSKEETGNLHSLIRRSEK